MEFWYKIILEKSWEVLQKISKEFAASSRMNYAFDNGIVFKPQIRRRSFANFTEYVSLLKCERPSKVFSDYVKDRGISYHAKLVGSPNLLIMSKGEIDSKYRLFGGIRSDFHVSFAPDHSWDKAISTMQRKVDTFGNYEYPTGVLKTHPDQRVQWDSEDEKLFRVLKYDLRQAFTPIRKKALISSGKFYKWLGNLEKYCTVFTAFYPLKISSYDPYLWMFETDYEDFIVDLFSELPTTAAFLKVGEKVIIFTHVERQYVRVFDFCKPKELQIPLLIDDLLDLGIVKSEEHAVIETFWRKEV